MDHFPGKAFMKNLFRIAVSIAVVCCLVAACASSHKVKPSRYNCSTKVAQAIKKYQDEKYGAVKTILDDVKLQCAGHEVMDTAQYYLAMSLVRMKEYPEAKIEFMRLSQDFPQGPFYDEAMFRVGYCVFKSSRSPDRDQAETGEAVKLFRDFLESNPSSPYADSVQKYLVIANDKLSQKEFENAIFYQKIGEKEAALVSYKTFIEEYPGSKFVPQAQLSRGQILMQLGRSAEAKETLEALVASDKQGEFGKKAQELLSQLSKQIKE